MKQLVTQAIILTRTDYGEADRILGLLTPDHGKLHVLAKGVRKATSKLAGGIELFSISTITFIPGKGNSGGGGLGRLVSTRLVTHYAHIVADLDRTMAGYEIIKQLNKVTEDQAEADYFKLLQQAFEALNDLAAPLPLIKLWFAASLLQLAGTAPNLQTDASGTALVADQSYDFSVEDMCFNPVCGGRGRFSASHIKFLRLCFAGHSPQALSAVQGNAELVASLAPLVQTMLQTHLRV